jgi:transposase-like protein
MGKRGPKPQFFDVVCPNKDCKLYGLTDQGNVTGNGTYISRGEKTRRYLCRECGKAFCDHTGTFYHDLRKDEKTIELALKMSMKGMSIEAIANVLEVQSASVKRWLDRASEQCDKVNESMITNIEVPKIEMDELWVIIQKNSSKNGKL